MKHFVYGLALLFPLFISVDVAAQNTKLKPNIVLINLDDADRDLLNLALSEKRNYYPNIRSLMGEGIRFTNLHVTSPICGPSRACLMRGQYAHNTGIYVNNPDFASSRSFPGGYPEYKRRGYTENDIGVWMRAAGYRTMMVGKYLHSGFQVTDRPLGWNEFYASINNFYYGTKRSVNGKRINIPDGVYRTTQEFTDALRLITQHQKEHRKVNGSPFFLYLAPHAPHVGNDSMVEERYESIWDDEIVERTPDFFEEDISDKPQTYQQLPEGTRRSALAKDRFQKDRIRSIRSVDDGIGRLLRLLRRVGEIDNTYVFLTSDNGYQVGHHRMSGKIDPYERNSNVPLIVTGPEVAKNTIANHLLAHIDITQTILDLGGATAPFLNLDSKSFRLLLNSPQKFNERSWRQPVVLESWLTKTLRVNGVNKTYHLDVAYVGLRSYDEVYIERASGEFEYYDLDKDPFQLSNSYKKLTPFKRAALSEKLAEVRKIDPTPFLRIDTPKFDTVSSRFTIGGMAQDDKGVRGVFVQILDTRTNEYWNGQRFQKKKSQVRAKLSSSNALLTNWHYDVPRIANRGGRKIEIRAKVLDNEGNQTAFSEASSKIVSIDNRKPTTLVEFPTRQVDSLSAPIDIKGTSTDRVGVKQVYVTIKDVENNLYWNGAYWVPERFEMEVGKAGNTRELDWKLRFIPSRQLRTRITMTVYAEDVSGNFEPKTKNIFRFRLTKTD